MTRMNFISLPVADVAASRAFYEAIGFHNNPQFSDESTACMVWSETFFAMVMTHEKWKTFTDRPIPDRGSSEVMLGLTCESRTEVDDRAERAGPGGGVTDVQPASDYGFMYTRSVTDPDGHLWEFTWMDPAAVAGDAPAEQIA